MSTFGSTLFLVLASTRDYSVAHAVAPPGEQPAKPAAVSGVQARVHALAPIAFSFLLSRGWVVG